MQEQTESKLVNLFKGLKERADADGVRVQLLSCDYTEEEIRAASDCGIGTFSDANESPVEGVKRIRFVDENGETASPRSAERGRSREQVSNRSNALALMAAAVGLHPGMGHAGMDNALDMLARKRGKLSRVVGNTTDARNKAVRLFEADLGRKTKTGTSMSLMKEVIKTANQIRSAYEELGQKAAVAPEDAELDYSKTMKAHELMEHLYAKYGEEDIDLAMQALIDAGHPSVKEESKPGAPT